MRLGRLSLRDFRNIAEVRVPLEGRRHFFVGANGQGKTNFLEAAGCLTALRSFRTTDTSVLIRAGAAEAAVAAELEHEHRGPTRLRLLFRADGKEVWADEERVKRLADHLGQFPVVAFSAHDLQLLRGAPGLRRRWLDLTLAAMDAGYLQALQTYTRALAGRNKLLKSPLPSTGELTAFEQVMAPAAATVMRLRLAGMSSLAASATAAYGVLSAAAEPATLAYAVAGGSEIDFAGVPPGETPPGSSPLALGNAAPRAEAVAEHWLASWSRSRPADLRVRSTLLGPHRDDVLLLLRGSPAREYGSEGQQRSLVLALRLAQAAWFRARSRTQPVILADDILGELDPDRRRRFWAALDPEAQVLATGTALPDPTLGTWQSFKVESGTFTPLEPGR